MSAQAAQAHDVVVRACGGWRRAAAAAELSACKPAWRPKPKAKSGLLCCGALARPMQALREPPGLGRATCKCREISHQRPRQPAVAPLRAPLRLPACRFISISIRLRVFLTATGVSRYQAAYTEPSASKEAMRRGCGERGPGERRSVGRWAAGGRAACPHAQLSKANVSARWQPGHAADGTRPARQLQALHVPARLTGALAQEFSPYKVPEIHHLHGHLHSMKGAERHK